jgi:hypothetical protein
MPKILFIVALGIVLAFTSNDFARAQGRDGATHNRQNLQNENSRQKPREHSRDEERFKGRDLDRIDRKKLKQELMSLPPEARQQRIKEIREEHRGKMQQGKQKFEQRWQNATSEERAQLCVKLQQRCEQGAKKHACRVQSAKCK